MMLTIAAVGVNSITDANLRSASIELTGAIKFSYDRSIMEKRMQRIAMDLDQGTWWIEYTQDPYALSKDRLRGSAGAEAEKDRREEIEDRYNFDRDVDKNVKAAMEGGLSAQFGPDPEGGGPRALPGDVSFGRVWTGHQEEPFESGVAYLHFFRGGWTEPAQIELTDGQEFKTLRVFPLTGRVRVYDREMDDVEPEEYDGNKEGDE